MDEKEKLRLQEEYQLLTDEEILEMLSFDKKEYEEGVYELILKEAKKRGIDKKTDQIEAINIDERPTLQELSLKDTGISGAIIQEAIINIIEAKGIATRREIMEEAEKIEKIEKIEKKTQR